MVTVGAFQHGDKLMGMLAVCTKDSFKDFLKVLATLDF